MAVILVPYHLDEPVALPAVAGDPERVDRPAPSAPTWVGLLPLHDRVADAVAARARAGGRPAVVTGDCTTAVAVLAGLHRAGIAAGIVWCDAHGDFNTPATTPSGYLGGLPLAAAVGLDTAPAGDRAVLAGLGLPPVPDDRVVLVGARDLDPGERLLLEQSRVTRCDVDELAGTPLPPGPLYLHVDLDVLDPDHLPGLRYPAAGGPGPDRLLAALHHVLAHHEVAAVGVACTWRPGDAAAGHAALLDAVLELVDGSDN
jgi:arginase